MFTRYGVLAERLGICPEEELRAGCQAARVPGVCPMALGSRLPVLCIRLEKPPVRSWMSQRMMATVNRGEVLYHGRQRVWF